jgi:hypothetical protein
MENTNGNKNGAKRRWKRPPKNPKFTAEELELIKASRAAMEAIQIQIDRGDFDHILKKEKSKI